MAERHILIVDDEDLVRSVLTRALVRHGFRVTQANNGSAALEAIINAPEEHDLVLLAPPVTDQTEGVLRFEGTLAASADLTVMVDGSELKTSPQLASTWKMMVIS